MNKQTASHQTIKIAPLVLRDVVAMHKVFTDAVKNHFEYFDNEYRRRVIAANSLTRLSLTVFRPRRIVLVAKHRGQIVGYTIGSVPKHGPAQIYWLFVAPSLRGSNIGLKLLSRMLKVMEQSGATQAVLVTHKYAKYYLRQGFQQIDTVKRGEVEEYILSYQLGKIK